MSLWSGRFPGEGTDYLLQLSCLGNPIDSNPHLQENIGHVFYSQRADRGDVCMLYKDFQYKVESKCFREGDEVFMKSRQSFPGTSESKST